MDFCLLGKNIGKNISKNVSSKYGQKLLDHAKKSVTEAIESSSKRVIQKTAAATGDLISNKMANKITKVSKNSQQINFQTVANENGKEIPKERYMSPKKRQEIIEDFRLEE